MENPQNVCDEQRLMRRYDFIVVPFGTRVDEEHITVWAENRGRAFTMAVFASEDPANVWTATLIRDGGQPVNVADIEEVSVDERYITPILRNNDCNPTRYSDGRNYVVRLTLFGLAETDEIVKVRHRAFAFTEAAIRSMTPDSVCRAQLVAVATSARRVTDINPMERYGGITTDLV